MFLTLSYRGHWLHMSCRDGREEWKVQAPDYTIIHTGKSLAYAKRVIRQRVARRTFSAAW